MKEQQFNKYLYTFLAGGIGCILLKHLGEASGIGLVLIAAILVTICVLIKYMWYERA